MSAAAIESEPRILIVRLGAMGDIIHALPAAASLRATFPGATIGWAIHPRWAPLLEESPLRLQLFRFNRKQFASVRSYWSEVRRMRFDLVLDLQGLLQSAVVARMAKSRKVIGYAREQAREPLASVFYSDTLTSPAPHMIDRHLDLASAAGARDRRYEFPLPPGKREGSLPEGPFVLASPHAGWRGKQWPLEFYSDLSELLMREFRIPLVLNGPPSAASELESVAGVEVHLSSIAGLIDATRRATAIVGVDSGPLHLAAALGRPGVAIFGPTDPKRNGPPGSSLVVLRDPDAVTTYKRMPTTDPSMLRISPGSVFAALKPAIETACV